MTQHDTLRVLIRVRYGECDAPNVMFNARYMDLLDVAFTEYERVIWGGHQRLLDAGLDAQVVSTQIDWSAAARFDDVLALSVRTARIGTSSFTLAVRFQRDGDDLLLATASVTYVMVDAQNGGKHAIPPVEREALAAGAPGVLINMAGVAG